MQREAPLPGFVRVKQFLSLHRSSNDDSRVDSGSTSTNGITLFKKTAVILCEYIQLLMASYQDFVGDNRGDDG